MSKVTDEGNISNEDLIKRLKKGEALPEQEIVPDKSPEEGQQEDLFELLPGELEDGPARPVTAAATAEASKPDPKPEVIIEGPAVLEEPQRETTEKKRKKKEPSLSLLSTVLALLIMLSLLWASTWLYNYLGLAVVSGHTIHWHTDLEVNIKGRRVIIPASVGIKGQLSNPSEIHTHEADNIIHWHNEGPVRQRDVRIGNFFKLWGEEFDKDHIMGNTRGRDGLMYMLVNGEVNHQYDRYPIQDGDRIEIILE